MPHQCDSFYYVHKGKGLMVNGKFSKNSLHWKIFSHEETIYCHPKQSGTFIKAETQHG